MHLNNIYLFESNGKICNQFGFQGKKYTYNQEYKISNGIIGRYTIIINGIAIVVL